METDPFIELEKTLPPVFARSEVSRLFPGMISPGRLANLEKEGKAPRKISMGRKVGYTRGDFIAWMRARNGQGAA
jgi:hypothetical protein